MPQLLLAKKRKNTRPNQVIKPAKITVDRHFPLFLLEAMFSGSVVVLFRVTAPVQQQAVPDRQQGRPDEQANEAKGNFPDRHDFSVKAHKALTAFALALALPLALALALALAFALDEKRCDFDGECS
ncbi:hypothetical protein ACSQ5K_15250 [Pseudomonas sp. PhalM4]